jgi:hypothetical protein
VGQDVIDDLKQFIEQKNNQLEQSVDNKIDNKIDGLRQFILQQTTGLREDVMSLKQDVTNIKQGMRRLECKVDDLSVAVAQAIDTVNATADSQLTLHEHRIARLERHTKITN